MPLGCEGSDIRGSWAESSERRDAPSDRAPCGPDSYQRQPAEIVDDEAPRYLAHLRSALAVQVVHVVVPSSRPDTLLDGTVFG